MPLYDIGDSVPLSLLVPDGDVTTNATVTYLDPNGGTGGVTPLPATTDGGKNWSTSYSVGIQGDWTFTWTVTGKGAGVEPYRVSVGTFSPPPWTPDLRAVADYIPNRTVPVNDVGDDPLLTFTEETIPNAEQAFRQIRSATRWVMGSTGDVDDSLYGQASDTAAVRAAGMIELSYPVRDDNVNTAEQLLEQADKMLSSLVTANTGETGESVDPASTAVPQFSFPNPFVTEKFVAQKTTDWM
jgi:hypothetical protein